MDNPLHPLYTSPELLAKAKQFPTKPEIEEGDFATDLVQTKDYFGKKAEGQITITADDCVSVIVLVGNQKRRFRFTPTVEDLKTVNPGDTAEAIGNMIQRLEDLHLLAAWTEDPDLPPPPFAFKPHSA